MTAKELDEYIINFLNGDNDAFNCIYYETQKSVYLSIRMIITNKSIIEDLMQDTYMKAIDNLLSYKIGTNFKAWISRIAHNTAINHYNKFKRIDVLDNEDLVFQTEESSPNLKYYLSFLDGIEKDVVIYHLILGMKFKEISEILDVPLSTTFVMYKKAIEKIKKEI